MDTILMNSEDPKTFKRHTLLLNLTRKIDLQGGKNQILVSTYVEKQI